MQLRGLGGKIAVLGAIFALGTGFASNAQAASHHGSRSTSHASIRGHLASRFAYHGGSRLQCVPFARENTGIELSGNAGTWWSGADGVYQRGARPEVGSVLNFRANGRMRMGHVAVVSNVIDARNIEIDHANWSGPGVGRGGISRNIDVVDVSPNNDWTAVRVSLGHTGEFGSVYPTFGFIYDRPDTGTLVANNASAPIPALNTPPRDLRPAAERMEATQDSEEVAEAADDSQPSFRRYTRFARNSHGSRYSHFAARSSRETFHESTRFARNAREMSHGSTRYASRAPAPSLSHVSVTRVNTHGAEHAHATRRRT